MIVIELIAAIIFIALSVGVAFAIILAILHKDYDFALLMIILEIVFILMFLDLFFLNRAIERAILGFLETEI